MRSDAARSLVLNDRSLKIEGVCAHQDHAEVGVAVPDSLWDYRLHCSKAMGANALRCAGNPPANELLDAADRIGIMVMDEHRALTAIIQRYPVVAVQRGNRCNRARSVSRWSAA